MRDKNWSYIDPNARLGKGVVVEPFSRIYGDVEIGEGTWIGSNVVIMDGARIGKHCKIFPGSVISGIPQDLKFKGEKTIARIGDNTTIRECVTINRGTVDEMETVVGKNCSLLAYSHVAHDCKVGNNCILSNNSALAGHVELGNFVILSGYVAIHQFCTLGDHAFVAAGTLVGRDIPPYVKSGRLPASYMGVNSIGLRRRGFTSEKIREIQNIYRILFQKTHNTSNALAIIEAEMEATSERDEILEFVRNSKRGIMKGYRAGNQQED